MLAATPDQPYSTQYSRLVERMKIWPSEMAGVELLDSPSMAVRVLSLENLRQITGTTLYFRAEQENATRRGQAIKKWIARLRNGIRWPE